MWKALDGLRDFAECDDVLNTHGRQRIAQADGAMWRVNSDGLCRHVRVPHRFLQRWHGYDVDRLGYRIKVDGIVGAHDQAGTRVIAPYPIDRFERLEHFDIVADLI